MTGNYLSISILDEFHYHRTEDKSLVSDLLRHKYTKLHSNGNVGTDGSQF